MDVFFYWKDHVQNIKQGHIGYFKSSKEKLAELADGYPDFIWAFKTPSGLKGQLQLLARLRWSDCAVTSVPREPGKFFIYYAPSDPSSVRFVAGNSPAAIDAISDWAKRHFPKMISSNFQGAIAQEAMRGTVLNELNKIAAGLEVCPFLGTE